MRIQVTEFAGQVSVLGPQRLDPKRATVANNCLIQSGDLVPFLQGSQVANTGSTANGTHSIYLYNSTRWVRFDAAVNIAKAPAPNDAAGRLYYTDGTTFKVTDANIIGSGTGIPAAYRLVGLPIPNTPDNPTYDQAGTGTITGIVVYTGAPATNKYNAVVTCSAAHGLKNGDTILIDFPGIDSKAWTVEIPGPAAGLTSSQFRVKGLRLLTGQFSKIVAPKSVNGVDYPVKVTAAAHGLADGDKVCFRFDCTVPGGFTPTLSKATAAVPSPTPYAITVIDADTFTLDGTEATRSAGYTIDGATGTIRKFVRVWEAANQPVPNTATYANGVFWTSATNVWSLSILPISGSMDSWTKTDISQQLRARSYRATFVNGYGDEGPPSDATGVFSVVPGTPVVFSALPTAGRLVDGTVINAALTGAATAGYYASKIRLYRTDEAGAWRFVTELAYGTTSYTDSALDGALGEVLETEGWYPPPATLSGLVAMPGGIMLGFVGKAVYASQPFVGSAWPLAYQLSTDSPIVGLVVTGAGVVVLTTGLPYLIVGTDPSTWGMVKIEKQQACMAARSIVDIGDAGLFASPEGLVAIAQNEAKVVTEDILSWRQWQTYNPATLIACSYVGQYFGSYVTSGSNRKGFLFDWETHDFVTLDVAPLAVYLEVSTQMLYYLLTDGKIYAFESAASALTYTWTSKLFQAPQPVNFAAAQVVTDGTGSVTFTLVADGVTRVNAQTVSSNEPFRLPSGFRALNWQFTLSGTARVRLVAIASSVDELKAI